MERARTTAARRLINSVARSLGKLPDLRGRQIMLGLSGGADSVALLHALAALRSKFHFKLTAAHVNHGIRATESDRDETFVRQLCAAMEVPLAVKRLHGLDRSGNLEARARQARRAALAAAAESSGADYIALAHQADDQAETVMLRLLRGAGVSGLGVMAESGPGRIIRPMLEVRRGDILRYLDAIGAVFVEDSSNASLKYDRNRLRHHLMPMLEQIYAPGLTRRLAGLAAEMREVDDLLKSLADEAWRHCVNADGSLDVNRFRQLHPAVASVLMRNYLALRAGSLEGFGRAHIDSLCALARSGPPNGRLHLPGCWLAQRRYGKLVVARLERDETVAPVFEVPLKVEGVTMVEAVQTVFQSRLVPRAGLQLPRDAASAVFDARALGTGLSVRNFRPGDRITPLGAPGSRKVKDVFIDRKVPVERRRRFALVLVDGKVAWLPGLARSNLALVTAETTQVVQLSMACGRCLQFN